MDKREGYQLNTCFCIPMPKAMDAANSCWRADRGAELRASHVLGSWEG